MKLQYCIIYTAPKNLYIHTIQTIDHISINIRRIEVVFGWKLSTGHLCFEFAIVGATAPPRVSRFEAIILQRWIKKEEKKFNL